MCVLQHPIPWHAQNRVHGSFALLQPHLDELQGISLSHPHFTRRKIASGARGTFSGRATGRSDFSSSFLFYPYFSGSRSGGSAFFRDLQTLNWWCARLTFCINASVVGGKEHSFGVDVYPLPVFAAQTFTRA